MFNSGLLAILHLLRTIMRSVLSERNLVIVLFVAVLITFALAQEDSKKMERMYANVHAGRSWHQLAQLESNIQTPNNIQKKAD